MKLSGNAIGFVVWVLILSALPTLAQSFKQIRPTGSFEPSQ